MPGGGRGVVEEAWVWPGFGHVAVGEGQAQREIGPVPVDPCGLLRLATLAGKQRRGRPRHRVYGRSQRQKRAGIFAQRLNAADVAQWTANGLAACNTIGAQYMTRNCENNAGGACLSWNDFRLVLARARDILNDQGDQ